MSQSLHIVHLYPREMNIYGDTGNTLILRRRAEWRGVEVRVSLVGIGDTIPVDVDIIVGGGGQDSGQDKIQNDLSSKAKTLQKMADTGVVMFMICGLYQLFGKSFTLLDGTVIKGISILPLETVAGEVRFIGNTLYNSEFGELVGYENHSGITTLDDPTQALSKVINGAGNNGQDKTEGCLVNNVFGTYSHGPALSKNPHLADELLSRALNRKYPGTKLKDIDDTLELSAYKIAAKRPR
jgi:lipid II isoglutaminyl synthase (glutamine-hydrolysing)